MPDIERSELMENYKEQRGIDGTELHEGVDGSSEPGFMDH